MSKRGSSVDDPAHWRQRAAESRRIADQLKHAEQKKAMLDIAESYERLALLAEKKNRS